MGGRDSKREGARDFAAAFKALGNENRLRVFEIIRGGPCCECSDRDVPRPDDIPETAVCVCEILAEVSVGAPTVSHHLKELRTAGLVDVYHRGQWAYYAVRPGAAEALAEYFQTGKTTKRR